MLTLTRKLGESVKIGDNIFIYVDRVNLNSVRLSFDAPREINIVRTEIIGRDDSRDDRPQTDRTESD